MPKPMQEKSANMAATMERAVRLELEVSRTRAGRVEGRWDKGPADSGGMGDGATFGGAKCAKRWRVNSIAVKG